MAGAEGARRALAMHEQPSPGAVNVVLFDLAGVVRDVVEQPQIGPRQDFVERLSDQMRDDLAIGQSAVDRGSHCAQVFLSDRRVDWRTGQLAVGQFDPVTGRAHSHLFQKLSPDLMPQPARSAVNADYDVVQLQAVGRSDLAVVDGCDSLNFEVVIAGTERPHLFALPVPGARRNGFGTSAAHPTALFDALQIPWRPVAAAYGPARSAGKHLIHLGVVQLDLSTAAHARGNVTK